MEAWEQGVLLEVQFCMRYHDYVDELKDLLLENELDYGYSSFIDDGDLLRRKSYTTEDIALLKMERKNALKGLHHHATKRYNRFWDAFNQLHPDEQKDIRRLFIAPVGTFDTQTVEKRLEGQSGALQSMHDIYIKNKGGLQMDKFFFVSDEQYQAMTKNFEKKKIRLESMVKEGIYEKAFLRDMMERSVTELTEAVKVFHKEKLQAVKERLAEMESKTSDVGYATRPDEVKEFEMKYKLANRQELEIMVQDLNSEDLLEINLLRMELKNRGMNEQEQLVRNYIIRHDIDGFDDIERAEYEKLRGQLATLLTMGDKYVVLDGELQSLEVINKQLNKMIVSAKEKVDHFVNRPVMQEKVASHF